MNYTIVICSCDIYSDAWDPLFSLFDRYWPESKSVQIVLNTETLTYQRVGFNITCPAIYKNTDEAKNIPWSKRLRDTLLREVKTDLVLIYLDDFYLKSIVDTERLSICIRYMQENNNIANLQLFPCPPPYTQIKGCPWLVKREKNGPYLFSLQVGLWRKERLLEFLRDHESPWYFERWGSLRGRRYPDEFYALYDAYGTDLIFNYSPSKEGLSKGLWLPDTAKLFEKEGIDMDLSVRGVMPINWKAPKCHRNWLKTGWNIWHSLCP